MDFSTERIEQSLAATAAARAQIEWLASDDERFSPAQRAILELYAAMATNQEAQARWLIGLAGAVAALFAEDADS